MLLYHYTAREYLPSIARQGLIKGEVPMSAHHRLNAVWLTSDVDPSGHGLSDGRQLTVAEKRIYGIPDTERARFPNKRRIRMDVTVRDGDTALVPWREWAADRVKRDWYTLLDKLGGGKAASWYMYWGTIPCTAISAVHDLRTGRIVTDRLGAR